MALTDKKGKKRPFVDGLATEEKQDAMIEAIGGISGTTSYRYIEKDKTGSTYYYYGFASTIGWKIKRKEITTGKWQYAEGTGDYDTAWADRSNQVYTN